MSVSAAGGFAAACCLRRLAAKLARAEDAAKRLLVKGDRTAKGGAAARLYEMEGEVQRLTDENIQLKHKLARWVAGA